MLKHLSELIVSKSPWTGNWADYSVCAPHACCGWMDVHNDDDGVVTLRPLYWDDDAVFVYTGEDNHYHAICKTEADLTFDSRRDHALVPENVADEIIERQDFKGPLYTLFEELIGGAQFHPKIVWDYVNASKDATT